MSEQDKNQGMRGEFGAKGEKKNYVDYTHPKSDELWEKLKIELDKGRIGHTLRMTLELYNLNFKVYKGKAEPGYYSDSKTAYIFVPSTQNEIKPKQILHAAKALRYAEQDLLGLSTPDPSVNVYEYASIVHTKNCDSIVYMCKVVDERKGTPDYSILLDSLNEMGHSLVYKTYVDGKSDDEMFDAYAGR